MVLRSVARAARRAAAEAGRRRVGSAAGGFPLTRDPRGKDARAAAEAVREEFRHASSSGEARVGGAGWGPPRRRGRGQGGSAGAWGLASPAPQPPTPSFPPSLPLNAHQSEPIPKHMPVTPHIRDRPRFPEEIVAAERAYAVEEHLPGQRGWGEADERARRAAGQVVPAAVVQDTTRARGGGEVPQTKAPGEAP